VDAKGTWWQEVLQLHFLNIHLIPPVKLPDSTKEGKVIMV
jgi:hypothetical protein